MKHGVFDTFHRKNGFVECGRFRNVGDGRVVGHVAISPVTISDGSPDWYGLGPFSVLPEFQKQGIGRALLQEGLARLKSMDGRGCVLVGDTRFYERFGFRNLPGLRLDGVPQEYFLALPFDERPARGGVVFHEGFSAKREPG